MGRESGIGNRAAVVVACAVFGVLTACNVSVTATSARAVVAGDSLTALLGDGPWRAVSLRVTNPHSDLIIDGTDATDRRLVITLYGIQERLVEGAPVTLAIDQQGAALVGIATLTSNGGRSVWSTLGSGTSGSFTYQRIGARIEGTFAMVLAPAEGSSAEIFRSIWNGRFSLTLP